MPGYCGIEEGSVVFIDANAFIYHFVAITRLGPHRSYTEQINGLVSRTV